MATYPEPAGDIRARRRALKMTRQQLAAQVPCSVSHLANIEQGMQFMRTSDVLPRLFDALDRAEQARRDVRAEGS